MNRAWSHSEEVIKKQESQYNRCRYLKVREDYGTALQY
jgi:hypothetical protein